MSDQLPRRDDGTLQAFAWPGGYPIYYICADNGTLCPGCANGLEEEIREGKRPPIDPECKDDDQWRIVAAEANYENTSLYCDDCGERIESAYKEDEVEQRI